MAIQSNASTEEVSGAGREFYSGLTNVNVVAVNPTMAELHALDVNVKQEPAYSGTSNDQAWNKVTFWLANEDGKFKLEISDIVATTEESYQKYLNSSLPYKTKIERVKDNSNQFELSFETSTYFNYIIESSSNLANWKIYRTIPGTGETISYILGNNKNNKFYRIKSLAK